MSFLNLQFYGLNQLSDFQTCSHFLPDSASQPRDALGLFSPKLTDLNSLAQDPVLQESHPGSLCLSDFLSLSDNFKLTENQQYAYKEISIRFNHILHIFHILFIILHMYFFWSIWEVGDHAPLLLILVCIF